MADYHPFHPSPRRPAILPPPGTCDSQFHVLGDPETYPTRPGAAYQMPTATWERARHVHEQLGISRGIIVQTTTYGADHSVVLDALKAMGANYKGCANALVFAEKDEAYLAELDAAGVNGARFSFREALGAVLNDEDFRAATDRLRDLGWYMKVQPEQTGIAQHVDKLSGVDIPILIDHMGRADASKGVNDENITALKKQLDRGNVWVMLSLGEKISVEGAPFDDVVPLAQTLIEHAPERCVWATDWPHPVSKNPPPNDADLLELFYRYAPDEGLRKQILVDNPAKLFGFEAWPQ
ncbi:4-sulfomuconolactone hydrolase [Pseudooceanicola marinus]|uniref:4-sulfomuconolactone hydrolase n=1 Tax=Pseudooceanicola marinus TaxID=396013 RepID=A0A1X6Z5A6_9RHOB|nr:amidohydrolase family protein [Pseudooceanicola marinus]PJE32267.1 2-pyrone-4,6-dicarboxylate hydrolase [Pseudooceanicola marinus]SLN40605.1 4-sulfomuconolactone hydrolase [Pseudooceanicola marinus]